MQGALGEVALVARQARTAHRAVGHDGGAMMGRAMMGRAKMIQQRREIKGKIQEQVQSKDETPR